MGRPPCCDKIGIKKGPWTPEEDIILVSYIQEHGPGNWRAVPTNTGLMRCSKSCRLRWTNYLRPGIKRGNFTPHEEGMIIHLQALLGNKWAAIATYLPQRTDNDIKNYWNTHLKKKLKKLQASNLVPQIMSSNHPFMLKQRTDDENTVLKNQTNIGAIHHHHENSSAYASSEENISRLLEGWMQSSPSFHTTTTVATAANINGNSDKFYRDFGRVPGECIGASASIQGYRPNGMPSDQEMEAIWTVDHHHSLISNGGKSSCDSSQKGSENSGVMDHEHKIRNTSPPPLSFLEKWLLEESGGQVEEIMELPSIF